MGGLSRALRQHRELGDRSRLALLHMDGDVDEKEEEVSSRVRAHVLSCSAAGREAGHEMSRTQMITD